MSVQERNGRRLSGPSLLLLGLLLGVAGGLYYAWIVDPVQFVNASPARLSDAHKQTYIYLVSQNLVATGDEPRAQQRLAALADPNIAQTVADLLETALREQRRPATLAALATLARALGVTGPTVDLLAPVAEQVALVPTLPVVAPTPPTGATQLPTPTAQPTVTLAATERPLTTETAVATATSRPIYRLLNRERLCEPGDPLLAVVTLDALLDDLPGVEVLVRWEDGQDRFFTGFKPEVRLGYGDFTMQPGVAYAVWLPAGSPEVTDLQSEPCVNGAAGGWQLTFQNLVVAPTATPEP